MPHGSRQRFGAPQAPQNPVRAKAPGLGTDPGVGDSLPQDDVLSIRSLEEQTPDTGFSGIVSRSRFVPPAEAVNIGHGAAENPVPATTGQPADPASGKSRFRMFPFPGSLGEAVSRALGRWAGYLGDDDHRLVDNGSLKYVRQRVVENVAGTRPADMIRWGEPPVPVARRNLTYTLRREFMQGVQSFDGRHTVFERGAHVSSSPVRMHAPVTSRLSFRGLPGSFGQTTEVLNA